MVYNFSEDLPVSCPPTEAYSINGYFYRLVSNINVSITDFYSQKKINPSLQIPPHVTECEARGTSIFDSKENIENVKKLPTLKDKKICEVNFKETDGLIIRTFQNRKGHYTLWLDKSFDLNGNYVIL